MMRQLLAWLFGEVAMNTQREEQPLEPPELESVRSEREGRMAEIARLLSDARRQLNGAQREVQDIRDVDALRREHRTK